MVEGKTLLVIHVSKGIRPIYCQKKYVFSSGGCSIRIGTTCREMTQEQIRIRYEQNFIGSDLMLKTPAKYSRSTSADMAQKIGVTKRTVERAKKKLQEKCIITRSGSKKPDTGS